jgi:hypothetical protein
VRRHRILMGVALLAACAWCGWVSGFHRTTAAAEVTWLITVAAVILVDVALWRGRTGRRLGWRLRPVSEPWPRKDSGGSGPALSGVAPWLVLIVVLIAWEILGIDTGPHQYHLTISALAQAYRPLNAGLLLVWMLVGIGYEAARVRGPIDSNLARPDQTQPQPPEHGAAFTTAIGSLGAHHGGTALLLPQSPPVGVAFWVAVPLAAVLIDWAARHSEGRSASAEEFIRFISTSRLANYALIAAWCFAGYHLFAR